MDQDVKLQEIRSNVLLHLYHSVVKGSINSLGIAARLKVQAKNPRHKDLAEIYDTLGPDKRRLFYNALTAIAEFVAYRAIDFIETYNRFEAEENPNEYPRLSLDYMDESGTDVRRYTLSEFGSEELGMLFKRIATDDQVRRLVDSMIDQLVGAEEQK